MNEKRDRENLRKLIREAGFGELEDYLLKYARPSIRVDAWPVEDENTIPIGQSKIGGRPDLPRDMEWVTVPSRDGRVSLPFIAQFDMKDVKPYDEENLLPERGILYFFCDGQRTSNVADQGRVIYFDGDPSMLERKEFPEDIPPTPDNEWGERYNPCRVVFIPEVNLPGVDANWTDPDLPEGKTWEDFYRLVFAASYPPSDSFYGQTVNRLLGYNYDIPTDMQLDCQLIAETGVPYYSTASAGLRP